VPATAASIKAALIEQLDRLTAMDPDDLVERRYKRLMSYGISS
jgi:acetyl-CoA carboxylase carboxyl transferase subunit alpha